MKGRAKELIEALRGRVIDHHRFLLKLHLQQIDSLQSPRKLGARMDEGAGKRRSTRSHKCAPWLKTALVTAAWAAARKKSGSLRAQFLGLKARAGVKKVVLAVAASMVTAAYHMLRSGVPYHDLGGDHVDRATDGRPRRA